MPNSEPFVDSEGEERRRRVVKFIRVPVPEEIFLEHPDDLVEFCVTLSYFGEPSTFRRSERFGLRLNWDMQGPAESGEEFRARINAELRPKGEAKQTYQRTSGFGQWQIGPQRRSRGTIQTDRLSVRASLIAGDKLIAVTPVLGWWDDRSGTREEQMAYSLIATVELPGQNIYPLVAQAVDATVEIETG